MNLSDINMREYFKSLWNQHRQEWFRYIIFSKCFAYRTLWTKVARNVISFSFVFHISWIKRNNTVNLTSFSYIVKVRNSCRNWSLHDIYN